MWPWEHLALGYLAGSAAHRLATGRPPDTVALLAVALGTQLPDLIDKPLAWTFDVLPSGLSLGHSLFFAVPVALLSVVVSRRYGRVAVGVVFALAYGTHLLGDVAFTLVAGGELATDFLLWPLIPAGPERGIGLLSRVGRLAGAFGRFLTSPLGQLYLLFDALLLGSAGVIWYRDGRPGLGWLRRGVKKAVAAL